MESHTFLFEPAGPKMGHSHVGMAQFFNMYVKAIDQ